MASSSETVERMTSTRRIGKCKEYAKLLRRVGLDMDELGAIAGQSDLGNPRIARFYHYFLHVVR
jgi:hypothetical protein